MCDRCGGCSDKMEETDGLERGHDLHNNGGH